jgi:2-keto-4-pentenoate hydratase/2-oxohepta-3-ene-1,7-dioic acid hydratase in catechol pathway
VKLATFLSGGNQRPHLGVVINTTTLLDLTAERAGSGRSHFESMQTLIDAGQVGSESVKNILQHASSDPSDSTLVAINDVRFCAPIPQPRKNVFCVGLNYLDHIREGDKAQDKQFTPQVFPEFFTKAPTTIIAAGEGIPSHAGTTSQLDYEGELGVVIGKRVVNLTEEDWSEAVFGYTVINDISARDIQHSHKQWFKGKSLDGSCPMGPFIVTADEIPNPQKLQIQTRVNGEVRQDMSTAQMIFEVAEVLVALTAGITLEPGDIIATGTPSGVGYAMNPPHFLKTGDQVSVTITGVGQLDNHVI